MEKRSKGRLSFADIWATPLAQQVFSKPNTEHGAELAELWESGRLPLEYLEAMLWPVWVGQPDHRTAPSKQQWEAMFRAVGYQEDGQPARRPWLPRRLYRGASGDRRYGLSWTTNPSVARHFLTRHDDSARVWTCVCHPSRILASGRRGRDSEGEFVLDTTGLEISEVPTGRIPAEWRPNPRMSWRLRAGRGGNV